MDLNKLAALNDQLEEISPVEIGENEIIEIDTNKIMPNPLNKKIYNTSDIDDLVEGIRINGQRQPGEVRPARKYEKKDGIEYVLISGERRFKAINYLGILQFKTTLVHPKDHAEEIIMMIENNNYRVKTAVEKAAEYKALQDAYKKKGIVSIREVIEKEDNISKSQQTRYNKINQMSDENKRLVSEGKVTFKEIDNIKSHGDISIDEQVITLTEEKQKTEKKIRKISKKVVITKTDKVSIANLINNFVYKTKAIDITFGDIDNLISHLKEFRKNIESSYQGDE